MYNYCIYVFVHVHTFSLLENVRIRLVSTELALLKAKVLLIY